MSELLNSLLSSAGAAASPFPRAQPGCLSLSSASLALSLRLIARLLHHTMASPLKVLVTGPAPSLAAYFTKLTNLQAKHSFDLILAQDLFSQTDNDDLELAQLLAGQIKVPVQVYVAVAGALPEKIRAKVASGEEICSNLSVLGQSSSALSGLHASS